LRLSVLVAIKNLAPPLRLGVLAAIKNLAPFAPYRVSGHKNLNMEKNITTKTKVFTDVVKWLVIAAITIVCIVTVYLIAYPVYNVYKQRKEGEAQLAHAQSSKEVAVAEAKAKMESSALLAQADTIRAHGVARSNAIIGESLKDNEAYLHWLWIDNIEKNPQAVIYVPTEANLPILEANRFSKMQTTEGKK